MSRDANVTIDITCPVCSRRTHAPCGIITFTWGQIRSTYRHHDKIRWLRDRDGTPIPPFTWIGSQDKYNFGDPTLTSIIAFDSDPNLSEYSCDKCKAAFEAIAVHIVDNRIVDGLAFLPGECARKFNRTPQDLAIVEIGPNGDQIIHDEWVDPPFTVV